MPRLRKSARCSSALRLPYVQRARSSQLLAPSSLSAPPSALHSSTPPNRPLMLGPWASLPLEALAPPGRLWLRPFTHSRAPPCRDGGGRAAGLGAPHHQAEA